MANNKTNSERRKTPDTMSYQRTKMQKGMIIEKLKDGGCRITKQRLMIIDIILENECSCCKEIYYKAICIDKKIGRSTIYRMINTLEQIGAISRKNMYKVSCSENYLMEGACTVVLDDYTIYNLSAQRWYDVIKAGLITFGYLKNQNIESITAKQCKGEGKDNDRQYY